MKYWNIQISFGKTTCSHAQVVDIDVVGVVVHVCERLYGFCLFCNICSGEL